MKIANPIINEYVYSEKCVLHEDPDNAMNSKQLSASLPISKYYHSNKSGISSLNNYGVPVGLVLIKTNVKPSYATMYGGNKSVKTNDEEKTNNEEEGENITQEAIDVLSDELFDKLMYSGSLTKKVEKTRKNKKQ